MFSSLQTKISTMSVDQSGPSLSISSTQLATCIKVLSNFAANDGYPSIESSEFDPIRPLINNLYHMKKQLDTKQNEDHRHPIQTTKQKTKNLRLRRRKKPILPLTNQTHPSQQSMSSNAVCSICQVTYPTLHFFYKKLCSTCAELNYKKRLQTSDLTNRLALVTGGRGKIGYRIVLKLLRANCFVITTSRFPIDLLNRLTNENDFEQWKDHIHIYGLDFRYSKLVELFTEMLIDKYDRLDFLINNTCQSISQTNDFYQYLMENERLTNYSLLSNDQQQILEGNLQFCKQLIPFSDIALSRPLTLTTNHSPNITDQISIFDRNQQSTDLHALHLNDINDVLAINTLAPFILTSKLKVLMTNKHPDLHSIKFVINVSTIDGSFSHLTKTVQHPHINAASAALNMMTRTSAIDYKQSNIYMLSVDAGWNDDEKTTAINDEEDAAARVLDPIFNTYQQLTEGIIDLQIPYGCLLKDYHISNW